MNEYKNGKIYLIYSKKYPIIYFGSTTKTIEKRLIEHENSYESFLNGTSKYVSSFEILKLGDYGILLVKECVCNSKKELAWIEGEYIKNNYCLCVNKYIPGRTQKEWDEDNKEKIVKHRKDYDHQNKEKQANQRRERNKITGKKRVNCPFCNSVMNKHSLWRHKKRDCKNNPNNIN
jgi:adenylate kinase family enzyme